MKTAIASQGISLDSKIDRHFGKCAYLWIHDDEDQSSEVVENPGRVGTCCVGDVIIQELVSKNVKRVIAGDFGSNVQHLLNQENIQMVIYPDSQKSVKQIIGLLTKKLIS